MQIVSYAKLENKDLRLMMPKALDPTLVLAPVQKIIKSVQEKGDSALLRYTRSFDNVILTADQLRVSEDEILQAKNLIPRKILSALLKAKSNIIKFHEKQLSRERWSLKQPSGATVRQIVRPIASVGIYVPGGAHPYPSSVLMAAIPAMVAQVPRVVVCTPPDLKGAISPLILTACYISKVKEIYRVGGPQSIAALAYGTQTIPKVDKVIGPGNQYVAAAKLLVHREQTDIDLIAGPSEIMILADETANPRYIALDLLSQMEHSINSIAILITTSKDIAMQVQQHINRQLQLLTEENQTLLHKSMKQGGLIVFVNNKDEAIEIVNNFAPEHLGIMTKQNEEVLNKINNAGSINLGSYSPVSATDYGAGPNHVLPTGGYAKQRAGLSCRDFIKIISVLEFDRKSIAQYASSVDTLAKAENLPLHGLAALERINH